jgi:hypothetical protein
MLLLLLLLLVSLQVMSVSEARACAIVDAGMKAVSLDSGPPQLLEGPNVAAGLLVAAGGSSSSNRERLPSISFEGVACENGGECLNYGMQTYNATGCAAASMLSQKTYPRHGAHCNGMHRH